jgi:hypothetical protein
LQLVSKSEERRPLGKLARRRENDIKIYFKEIGLIWLAIGTSGHLLGRE